MRCRVLLSADDRTGALEIGGLVADETHTVPVGPAVDDPRCCVVDIATRHLTPAEGDRGRGVTLSSQLAMTATVQSMITGGVAKLFQLGFHPNQVGDVAAQGGEPSQRLRESAGKLVDLVGAPGVARRPVMACGLG